MTQQMTAEEEPSPRQRSREGEADPSPATPGRGTIVWRKVRGSLGIVPFSAFVLIFLILPVIVNIWTAFVSDGHFAPSNFLTLFEKQYRDTFINTIELSLAAALISGVAGTALAWALVTAQRPRWLKSIVYSFSIVASRSGGVPLAFAFVAAIGTQGLVTQALRETTGLDLANAISLSSFRGLLLVYLYFEIPLMAVLMLPALQGLRREWSEASQSLGASPFHYVKDIAVPIITPALLGSLVVVFADAFQAYATAYALAGGGANLVAILIGFYISGNVLTDPALAATLVTGMIIVVGVAMLIRALLLRKTTQWQR